jgi:hypothetical protein
MPRLEKSGYKRFWELKQLAGHNRDGTRRTVEGFRDMTTGEFHTSVKGWNGQPPPLSPGERDPVLSNRYKDNYERTFGHE